MKDNERYRQIVYYRIYTCDINYFLQHYADKIDFQLINGGKYKMYLFFNDIYSSNQYEIDNNMHLIDSYKEY